MSRETGHKASYEMVEPLYLQHLAPILLQLAGVDQPPCELTPEEAADLDASLAEAAKGEFATDEEVRAVWAKHGL